MYRYVAVLWRGSDVTARAAAQLLIGQLRAADPGWKTAFASESCCVLHIGAHQHRAIAYSLHDGTGVVLGRLFKRDSPQDEVRSAFDPPTSRQIVRSQGRFLLEHYWGRYVALLTESDGRYYCLRDPSGLLPGLHVRQGPLDIVYSDMTDVSSAGTLRLSINWQYLKAFLAHNHLQISATGFVEVRELQAGELFEMTATGVKGEFLWDPVRISESGDLEDFAAAASSVRKTAMACIGAWGSSYSRILHRLSGGLDSSVALGCLAQSLARPLILCETSYSTAGQEADERRYARLAARRAGCELVETELHGENAQLEMLRSVHLTAKPSLACVSFQHEYVSRLVAARSIEAITTGQGGDQVFFRLRRDVIAADYARAHGIRPALFKVILDTARLTRTSVWSILRAAVKYGLLRRRHDGRTLFLDTGSLARREVLREIDMDYLSHPWLAAHASLPPAKFLHVMAIADLQYYNEPSILNRNADTLLLLATQPLIELCLRIPTYVLTRGGIDRALERHAFAGDAPREVLARQSKGATTRYFSKVLAQNRPFIRELLLDGTLMREGLLDRVRLERSLTADFMVRHDGVEALLSCVAVEIWLNSAHGVQTRSAA